MRLISMLCFPMLAMHGLASAFEDSFTFAPPGELEPHSGMGLKSDKVYFPTLRFPLEAGPAFLNSQVYRPGGGHASGSGGQCAAVNYSYPWRDNFCETRDWKMQICPAGQGHQGQDVRPSTCQKNLHWAVAVEDGIIAHIGPYSVTLQTRPGTLFRYLHLNMSDLAVHRGDVVKKGARIGKVSNDFNGTPTTIHLHFDAKDTVRSPDGKVTTTFVPPYTSLIASYKRLLQVN